VANIQTQVDVDLGQILLLLFARGGRPGEGAARLKKKKKSKSVGPKEG